jgi:hypothetical protein
VLAQRAEELAEADIDRINAARSGAKEHSREAAGGSAEVESDTTPDGHSEDEQRRASPRPATPPHLLRES